MIDSMLAQRVKLLGLDVDGVLTDNAVWIGSIEDQRVEFKRFDISDGLALVILRYTDIEVAWVSGRPSEATTLRARELRIDTVIQVNGARKLEAMDSLLKSRKLGWEDLAFVGDDLADLPLLKRAGLPITVANACPEALERCMWTTKARGGQGAVREVVEGLLRARGEWDGAVAKYLRERGETTP
ncbi:MAG TPA: HAD hydrolase family protein [Gemmatimonadales bacterium]|nr:HAD hydrolase family protein [Gemmatimonadales bacterium]